MSAKLSIPVVKEQLTEARAKTQQAITLAKKAGAEAVNKLAADFLDSAADSKCTEEPIVLPSTKVTVAAYDAALQELSLLAGNEVEAGDLTFDIGYLIRNAGQVITSKKLVEIRAIRY